MKTAIIVPLIVIAGAITWFILYDPHAAREVYINMIEKIGEVYPEFMQDFLDYLKYLF